MLSRSNFIMFCFGRNSKFPELFIQIMHISRYSWFQMFRNNDLPFPDLLELEHRSVYVRIRSGLFSYYKDLCLPGSIPVPDLRLY